MLDLFSKDPEKVLRRLVDDMKEGYQEAAEQVAAAEKDEEVMRSRLAETVAEQEQQTALAKRASAQGDRAVADDAEAAAERASHLVTEYSSEVTKQAEAVAQLKAALAQMAQKIKFAEDQMETLLQRVRSKKADAKDE